MIEYFVIGALVGIIGVQTLYSLWRVHMLEDERDEAREIAEEQRERLLTRPVRVRTIIYANGEKISENLSK